MLQIIENFLSSIFYNYPEMKGGSDKVKIIIRKKPEEKKIIRIKLSDYAENKYEPKQKIIIINKSSEPQNLKNYDDQIVEENPVKKTIKKIFVEKPDVLTLSEAIENLDRFNVLGSNKLKILNFLTIEALNRRQNKILESKEEIDDVKDLKIIDLEAEYIEILKTKKYLEGEE